MCTVYARALDFTRITPLLIEYPLLHPYSHYSPFSPTATLLHYSYIIDRFDNRFGVCEPYKGGIKVCDGVLTEEEDYMFITTTHGSQKLYQLF